MNRDFIAGSATLVLAVVYYVGATTIPNSLLADAVGPRGLPVSYAVVLGGLSILLMAKAMIAHRRAGLGPAAVAAVAAELPGMKPANPAVSEKTRLRRAAGMLAVGVCYLAALPWLGYVPSLACLIAVTAWYQGIVPGWRLIMISVMGAAIMWLLFVVVLGIPQPAGLWPDLF